MRSARPSRIRMEGLQRYVQRTTHCNMFSHEFLWLCFIMFICLMIALILLPVVRFENWVRSVSDTKLSSSRRWPDVVGLPPMPKSRWSRPFQELFECNGIDLYCDALRCIAVCAIIAQTWTRKVKIEHFATDESDQHLRKAMNLQGW